MDDPESELLSISTYHRVMQQFYYHALQEMANAYSRGGELTEPSPFIFQGLPTQSKAVLEQIATQHNFPAISQKLM